MHKTLLHFYRKIKKIGWTDIGMTQKPLHMFPCNLRICCGLVSDYGKQVRN